jgi:signal transduction histidine kinase
MEANAGNRDECFRARDGSLFWVETNTSAIMEDGRVDFYACGWQDITAKKKAEESLKQARDEMELRVIERTTDLMAANRKLQRQIAKRKKAEKELINSREQLRNLSSHLQSIREKERKNLAREIHDELGQSLTALNLNSSWLLDHLPPEHEQLRGKVKVMLEIIDSTITKVKRLSTELRPGLLDDLGIIAAIEWQSKKFQETTGIRCSIRSPFPEIDLDKERSTAIFRIFQETLTNVARHASATMVRVQLREKSKKLILKVEDNGIGITEEQIAAQRSLGLLGIRERVRSLRGELKIKGIPALGTTVIVSIPLDTKEKYDD